ncbi:putative prephenate dehydratase [Erysiphe necator]|uniref:prephenate dehydratase n=1 Tax=Uncinula necator TaxID=52586 RepID=A0A0B1PAM1_UNCNE|nr:putative prephenate dehydratase [Erysiphe necator]
MLISHPSSVKLSLPVVTYLGPPSSYTHQAALQCLDFDSYEFQPSTSISDIFESVQSGAAELGVIPIENSTNGPVILSFELLADRENLYPNVNICKETYLKVSHYLLGRQSPPQINDSPVMSGVCTPSTATPLPSMPRSAPLCSIKHIKCLYSHPQVWGQCEVFLTTYFKGIDRIDTSSTSMAAHLVCQDRTGTSAAIASKLASKLNNLDILAEEIEDDQDNTTRFLVLCKDKFVKSGFSGKTRTMISFEVQHENGALASVLDCFAKSSLNLTSINSRPTKAKPFQYIFFLEFQGSLYNDPEKKVKNTLEALQEYVRCWRFLGSWDDQLNS